METDNNKPAPVVLSSGALPVQVMRDGEPVTFNPDLLLLQIAGNSCVERHKPEVSADGRYLVGEEFLLDLAAKFAGLGVVGCTPSEARQLWIISQEMTDGLQKKTSAMPNSRSGSTSTRQPKRRKKK